MHRVRHVDRLDDEERCIEYYLRQKYRKEQPVAEHEGGAFLEVGEEPPGRFYLPRLLAESGEQKRRATRQKCCEGEGGCRPRPADESARQCRAGGESDGPCELDP